MIIEFLIQLKPDSEALLREISKQTDDEILEWISTADYGSGADEHMVALRQVRDSGTFPEKMHWYPMEVLELVRWSEPENPDWKPGRTGEFGHWMRAFSCAAILRATREPWNYGDGVATGATTIQLIHSLRALPVDFSLEAMRFFAWLLLQIGPEGNDDQVCAYGIALLWFALKRNPPISDEDLLFLAKWIARRARELYAELLSEDGVLPLRMGVGNPPPSRWDSLGNAFWDLDLINRPSELKELVHQIGLELAG